MLVTIVLDILINQNADKLVGLNTSAFGIALFIVMASVCMVGQYFILEYVKNKILVVNSKVPYLGILHIITTVTHKHSNSTHEKGIKEKNGLKRVN